MTPAARGRILAAVLAGQMAVGAVLASATQEPGTAVHPAAREAISTLWSPYCPGLMLEVCPSSGATAMRDSIDVLARSGLGADSIVDLMVAEYGEEYRAVPLRRGVGGLAWFIPPVALLAGFALVALVLARRRRGATDAAPARTLDASDEARLREAMRELDAAEAPDF